MTAPIVAHNTMRDHKTLSGDLGDIASELSVVMIILGRDTKNLCQLWTRIAEGKP